MARLIDDLRRPTRLEMPTWIDPRREREFAEHAAKTRKLIMTYGEKLPVILADNVSDYYFTASGQEHWDVRQHFPNIAPPFPIFWVEHRFPKLIHSDQKGDTDLSLTCPNGRCGTLIIGSLAEKCEGKGIPPEAHWILLAEQFIDFGIEKGKITGPIGTFVLVVDAEGRALDVPWVQAYIRPEDTDIVRDHMAWLHPVLLTMCFMHCRNVTVTDQNPDPKYARRYAERHNGLRPMPVKTLIIEPLKQILRREGRSDQHGAPKAMHICRGHFKDYREGKGLFGKYHQVVWHESVVRGTGGDKAPEREIKVKL